MKSSQPNPTPNWKAAILTSPDWPDDLVVPQTEKLPADSEAIQDSVSANEKWEWELWRHPDGHGYYLKIWPMDQADFGNARTPAAPLTVMEAFQFLLTNWMPRDVVTDLIFDHPELIKTLGVAPEPGLN